MFFAYDVLKRERAEDIYLYQVVSKRYARLLSLLVLACLEEEEEEEEERFISNNNYIFTQII